jgi:hypothetical protein
MPFTRLSQAGDAPAADQQRSETCKPAAYDKARIQLEFNVLNLNLMAPPGAAPII